MLASSILAFSVSLSGLGEVLRIAEPIRGASLDNAADYSVFAGDMTKPSAIAAYGVIDGWCERVIATTPLNARTNSANAVCNALGPLKTPALRDWRGSQTNALVANPAAIAFVRDSALDIAKGRSDGPGGCTWLMPWSLGVPEVEWTADTNAFDSAELWNGRLVRTIDIARNDAFGAAKSMIRSPFHIGDYPRSSDSLGWEDYSMYSTYLYSVWGATYWDEDGRDEIEQDGRLDPYAFLYARPVIALMGKALVEPPPVRVTHRSRTWINSDYVVSAKKIHPAVIGEDEDGDTFVIFPESIGEGTPSPIVTNRVSAVDFLQNGSVASARTESSSTAAALVRVWYEFNGFVSDHYDDGNCLIMGDTFYNPSTTPGVGEAISSYAADYEYGIFHEGPLITNATFEHLSNDVYRITTEGWSRETQAFSYKVVAKCASYLTSEVTRFAYTKEPEEYGVSAGDVLPQVTDITPGSVAIEAFSAKYKGSNVVARTREIVCDGVDVEYVTNAIVRAVKEDADSLLSDMENACGGHGFGMIPLEHGGAATNYRRARDMFEGQAVYCKELISDPEPLVVELRNYVPVAAYMGLNDGTFKRIGLGDVVGGWTGSGLLTNYVEFTEHEFSGSTHTVTRQMMNFDWKNYKGGK